MDSNAPAPSRWVTLALCMRQWGAVLAIAAPAVADGRSADAYFLQAGWAEHGQTATLGWTWDTSWQREFAHGRLTAHWEASFGRWRSETASSRREFAWVTQVGVTPVLRWQPQSWERWFMEAGIGANLLLPIYRSGDHTFSTAFNFGDHIAVGRRVGEAGKHEVLLRLQHYSNASIKQPNPGENFVQLRYVHRF
jgi:lipid A 3-O-deacylase